VFVTRSLGGGDGGVRDWHEEEEEVVVTWPVLGGGGVFDAVSRRWWVRAHLTHIPIHVPRLRHPAGSGSSPPALVLIHEVIKGVVDGVLSCKLGKGGGYLPWQQQQQCRRVMSRRRGTTLTLFLLYTARHSAGGVLTVTCNDHYRLVFYLVSARLLSLTGRSHPPSSTLVRARVCSHSRWLTLAVVSTRLALRSCLLAVFRTCFGAYDGSVCWLHPSPPIVVICTCS